VETRELDTSLLQGRMLVGLYGSPGGRGLGILGRYSPAKTISLTLEQAVAYQALLTDTQVVPFFHLVVTIADGYPGADGAYSHRVSMDTVQAWIDAARAHGLWSVVDVQVGHSPLDAELAYVEPFLRQRTVHLAIDPEFVMSDTTRIPGTDLGFMTGAQINHVQAWLNGLAAEVGERKILVIHQFNDRMFDGKEEIDDYPLVELVWDADGFGPPGPKIKDYVQYAGEPGFEYGGMKIFYEYDDPLMSPAYVLSLQPRPAFVVYQ